MKKITLLFTFVVAVMLVGCGTVDSGRAQQAQLELHEKRAEKIANKGFVVGEQVDKIVFPRLIDSWGYLDKKAIWLETSPRRLYLVTTRFPCNELEFAQSIALKSQIGAYFQQNDEILSDRGSQINCRVDTIYKMSKVAKELEPSPHL